MTNAVTVLGNLLKARVSEIVFVDLGQFVGSPARYDDIAAQIARIARAHTADLPDGRKSYPERWIVRVPKSLHDEHPLSWGDEAGRSIADRAAARIARDRRGAPALDVTVLADPRLARRYVVSRPDVSATPHMATVDLSSVPDAPWPHLLLDDGRRVLLGRLGRPLDVGRGVPGSGRLTGDLTMSRRHLRVTVLGEAVEITSLGKAVTVANGSGLPADRPLLVGSGSRLVLGRTGMTVVLPIESSVAVPARQAQKFRLAGRQRGAEPAVSIKASLIGTWDSLDEKGDIDEIASITRLPVASLAVSRRIAQAARREEVLPPAAVWSAYRSAFEALDRIGQPR